MLVSGLALVVIEFQFGKDLSLHSYYFQKFSVASGHFLLRTSASADRSLDFQEGSLT